MENKLQIGEIKEGTVKNIKPYGAFVEIEDGLVGLLKIEDISISRIKSPSDRFNINDKINVLVKSIDEKENRVFFSHKELLGTWEDNIKKFEEGMTVPGIIREAEKSKNGIFIELEPNLVGMADYSEKYEYGQQVDVYIKKIIPEKKKIKLAFINIK